MSKKIKKIHRYSQRYKNFSFSEVMAKADEEFLEAIIEMDEQGNVNIESKFDRQGGLEEKSSLSYNSNGKLLEQVLYYALDDFSEKIVNNRDEKGRLIEQIKYYGEDSGERTCYEYNQKDLITAIIEYDEEGDFLSREEILYDDKNEVSQRIKTDKDHKLIDRILFEKTQDDLVLLEKEFNADEELKHITTITFNEQGKEVSSHQSNPDGRLVAGVRSTYDEKGNIIERKFLEVNSRTVKYEYDENSRMITQELYDNSGLLLRKNMYEYDELGNLTTEQTFEMDNSRGATDKHYGTRYEYEFYPE